MWHFVWPKHECQENKKERNRILARRHNRHDPTKMAPYERIMSTTELSYVKREE